MVVTADVNASNGVIHVVDRVLLRGPNSPMMAACWFAIMKAGASCSTQAPSQ